MLYFSFFPQANYKDYVELALDALDSLKIEEPEKRENQLTKYYQIGTVIAKSRGIDLNHIHCIILAPEYKQGFCERDKENYYYGEKYAVSSYKLLKDAVDAIINNPNAVYQQLTKDIKAVIEQFERAIWPYISDTYTYYKRTMSNRFARITKELRENH